MRAPYVAVSPKERSSSMQTAEHYKKYKVCDPSGRRIGRTERVFANGRGEPEYIKVKLGLFGLKTVLLPVQSVFVDEERRALVLQ
jgi:rRNA processing protein Gar1